MTLQRNMQQAGIAVTAAAAISGVPTLLTLSTQAGAPTGNSQATAAPLPSDCIILKGSSVGASTGYLLPPADDNGAAIPGPIHIGDQIEIYNQGGQTLSVYPNTAAGKIQGGGAGAAFSVTNNHSALFTYMGGDFWGAVLSA